MLKKMSFVFCAGLLAAAIAGGCKKDEKSAAAAGGGECAALGAKLVEEGMGPLPADAPAEAKKAAEEMRKKVSAAITGACKDDKWSADAIKCGLSAKDPEQECKDKLSKTQIDNMNTAAMKAMEGDLGIALGELADLDDKPAPVADDVKPTDGDGAAADKAAAGDPASTGLVECDEYLVAVEKLGACDKIPQEQRDATLQSIDGMKAAWGDLNAVPPEARQQIADACKQGSDGLKQGAQAMGCEI